MDPDGDALQVESFTPSLFNASFALTSDRTGLLVTATAEGTGSGTYLVSDGRGESAVGQFTITVTQPNRPPKANDDVFVVTAGETSHLQFLLNDTDPDAGDVLTITSITQPSNGTLILNSNGTADFLAEGSGVSTGTYWVSDGEASDQGAYTITVEAPNLAPVGSDDFVAITDIGGTQTINLTTNDSDPENDPLTVTSINPPFNTTVTLSGTSATFTATELGTQQGSYVLSDGEGNLVTVGVTAVVTRSNTPPTCSLQTLNFTAVNQIIPINFLSYCSDADGDTLQVLSVTEPSNASVNLYSSSSADVTSTGYGTVTGTFRVTDGHGGPWTFNYRVSVPQPANQDPIARSNRGYRLGETESRIVNVLANDTDPDGDPLTITSVTQPLRATVQILHNPNRLRIIAKPNPGHDHFRYTISDGRGGTDSTLVFFEIEDGSGGKPLPLSAPPSIGLLEGDKSVPIDGEGSE